MTQKELMALVPGTSRVKITATYDQLRAISFAPKDAEEIMGKVVTVTQVVPENDKIRFIHPTAGSTFYVHSAHCQLEGAAQGNEKPAKPEKFGKKHVLTFATEGSNTKLKSELASRLQSARNLLSEAVKPEDFNAKMRAVKEQLRQAKLIRAAIK